MRAFSGVYARAVKGFSAQFRFLQSLAAKVHFLVFMRG